MSLKDDIKSDIESIINEDKDWDAIYPSVSIKEIFSTVVPKITDRIANYINNEIESMRSYLNGQINSLNGKYSSLESNVNKTSGQLNSLNSSNSSLSSQISQLQSADSKIFGQISELSNRISKLENP